MVAVDTNSQSVVWQVAMEFVMMRLFRFDNDLGALPLARMKNDGVFCPGRGGASAVGVVLEAELAPAQFRPKKSPGGHGYNDK